MGSEMARLSDFFYKESKSKKNFFWVGGGGGRGSRISFFFFLQRIQIYKKKIVGEGGYLDGQTQTNLPILLLKDNNCAKLF